MLLPLSWFALKEWFKKMSRMLKSMSSFYIGEDAFTSTVEITETAV